MSTTIYSKILEFEKSGTNSILATVIETIGSAPRKDAAKMLITHDHYYGTVGGGQVENQTILKAKEMLKSNLLTATLDIDITSEEAMGICGGKVKIFLERLSLPDPLYIYGAGHVGFALAEFASKLNFQVTLIDDRKELLVEDRLPPSVIAKSGTLKELSEITFSPQSYIVLVTRGHNEDKYFLENLIHREYRYIGMIGSKTKVSKIFSKLRASGIPSDLLAKVHAPIGLSILAETPEEIAISILAELISIRRSS